MEDDDGRSPGTNGPEGLGGSGDDASGEAGAPEENASKRAREGLPGTTDATSHAHKGLPMLPPAGKSRGASEGVGDDVSAGQDPKSEAVDGEVLEEETLGWEFAGTEDQRRAKARFIASFRKEGIVNVAVAAAGWRARSTAKRHRDIDPNFAAAWREAREDAADALEREARRRAVEGVDEPIYYKGEEVGTVRRYSDRLLEYLLGATRPEKFRPHYEAPKKASDDVNRKIAELAERLRLDPGKPPPAGGPERVPEENEA